MDRGYVKLWRKSLDSSIIHNPELFMFWCWCLMKATHKPIKIMVGFQEVELSPGQFVFGRKMASEELPLSEQTIRTCVDKLKKLENLTIKSTNKFSIISIVNWRIYQCEENQINQHFNQQVTSNQPASNHKQECKECKEEKASETTNVVSTRTRKKESVSRPHERVRPNGNGWEGITETEMDLWRKAYPAVDVSLELHKALTWISANPDKRKKNWYRFLCNWLSRCQERGGSSPFGKPESNRLDIDKNWRKSGS